MYEVIQPFIEAAAYIIDGYCLCILFGKFGGQRIKREVFSNILTISAWLVVNLAIRNLVFSDLSYTLEKSLLCFVFRICAIYVIGVCFYRNRQIIHLFLTLLFIALLYVFSEIGYIVRLFLVDGLERLTWHIEVFHNVTTVKLLVDSIYCLMDMTAVALFYFSIKTIVKNHNHSIDERSTKELIAHILPTLLGSLVSVALYFVLLMINERGYIMEYDNYGAIYLFVIIVFVAVWLIILYGFRIQEEMMNLQEERTQKSVLENQISQMQNSMLEMERFYESVSHVKHDMKNQMAVMEKLLRERQITENEEITGYFEDMQKTLLNLEQKIHTGNVVSDAVISSKFYYASKELQGIHLEADGFLLTDKVHVRAYDIGIILNNGLDNAIEACQKVRLKNQNKELYIKIKSFWKQKMFFIEIENSFDGEIVWGKDGFPCSQKADSNIHGIGLKNIRYCALKYAGDMDCIAQEEKFILSVMLKG